MREAPETSFFSRILVGATADHGLVAAAIFTPEYSLSVDCYEIWVNLQPGVKDLEFVEAINVYLGYLRGIGKIESYRVRRRKLGFGPESLGEWNITIECASLAQLEEAFLRVATRESQIETMHSAVFSKVCDFRSGLYRDFPDEVRVHSHGA